MKKFYASLAVLLTVVSTVVALNFGTNQSQAAWNGQDCTTNAIIKCGAHTRDALKNKVNSSSELKNLYNHFDISPTMINSGTVKEGVVHKNGNVTVSGKVVATDAWSVGRESVGGSEQKFKVGSKSYWKRPTTNPNIFNYGDMTAFVFYDKSGKYVGTIIKSCGNPVFSKPKVEPPKPAYSCASLSRIKQDDPTTYVFQGKSKAANGAKHKGFTFEFGDGNKRYVGVQRTSDGGKYGYADTKHAYKKSGTYNVKVTAHFTVDGKEVTHTQANCAKPVTIKVKQPPKEEPKKNPGVSIDKTVRAEKTSDMTKEQALEQARNFKPKGNCTTVITPAVHVKTGARYTFNNGCLPSGWVAERNYTGTDQDPTDWAEHAVVTTDKEFAYRLVVKNTGDVDLKNVAVSDPAPAGIQFVSAEKGAIKNNVWTYTVPTLKVKQSVTVVITAKVAKVGLPTDKHIKNTACVDAKEVPGDKDDCDDATVEVKKPPKEEPPKEEPPVEKPEMIEVCEFKTGEIIEIRKDEYDEKLHGDVNHEKCQPKEEPPVEEPKDIKVCEFKTGETITIKEDEFDEALHGDENHEKCDEKEVLGEEKPTPKKGEETPEVIAATGPATIVGGLFGSSALGLGVTGYVRSRRALSDLLS